MSFLKSPAIGLLGILLTRFVVPLWVMTGAMMKLMKASPKLLPENIVNFGFDRGIDLYSVLFVIIGLEVFAVAVMVFIRPLARLMAAWMLLCFCGVLIGELAAGNTSCGCLGGVSPPPLLMLTIDGLLLLGVLLFKPGYKPGGGVKAAPLAGAVVTTLAGFVVAGLMILPEMNTGTPDPDDTTQNGGTDAENGDGDAGDPDDGSGNGDDQTPPPSSEPRPGTPVSGPYYVITDTEPWVGMRFKDIDLAQHMPSWPHDYDTGTHYVIFYSRSCDHCQMLLENYFYDFIPDTTTTLVAVPEDKTTGFDRAGELDMQFCRQCVTELEMAVGTDWIISPPVVFVIRDGIVECVIEGEDADDPQCLFH